MDLTRLQRLQQVDIPNRCPEEWEMMEGGESRRFCDGCQCFVHNVAEMKADEAEDLLMQPNRVCARIVVDTDRRILTKDGWIPRLFAAGVIAAGAAGCTRDTSPINSIGKVAIPVSTSPKSPKISPSVELFMGDVAPPEQIKPGRPKTAKK
jgi:hypothetical protein